MLFLIATNSCAQEWKNIKAYKKATGNTTLQKGNWLTKDRNKNTKIWQAANKYNLASAQGNLKYKSIVQIRDFYFWFDEERKKQGHEIVTAGVAGIVASQLAHLENYFIRIFIVRNKEIVWFGTEGSAKVMAFVFPLFRSVYFSDSTIKGEEAINWDLKNWDIEQCKIVATIYNQLSDKSIKKLTRMAKGKGIYALGIKKELKYEGDLKNCQSRSTHAATKLRSFYLLNFGKL